MFKFSGLILLVLREPLIAYDFHLNCGLNACLIHLFFIFKMIFLTNQLPREENGHNQHNGRHQPNANRNGNVISSNRSGQQEPQGPNSSSNVNQMRSRQIRKNRDKEKTVEILASVMAVFGIIGILGGIGLLVFGILGKEMAGTISGAVLIALGLLSFVVIGVLLCTTSNKTKSTQNTVRTT